ncbi:MAG: hypothetical protein MUF73_03070 [Rhodobacteraceae bacterium]|nr:hypothetical protein [Paracoccaceae bacterium]
MIPDILRGMLNRLGRWLGPFGRSAEIEAARQRNTRAAEALDAALKEVLHR